MVRPYMPFQDLDVVRFANLSYQIPQADADLPSQDRLAVLWDEHEVVVTLVNAVRPAAIVLHRIPKYRKPPEGFA